MKSNPSQSPLDSMAVAKSDSLVVYPQQSRTPAHRVATQDKKGLFSKRKRRAGPSREQIIEFIFEWIDSLPESEARMLQGIFSLSNTTVREIMIPLSEMMAVHIATPTAQVKAMVRHSNYRYIPVYEERIDRLTGIVNIMDILYSPHEANELSSFTRAAYYVPETKLTGELLNELRAAEDPVAIVIDEHAGCVGLVTLEDIFEQVVGEIGYNHKRHTLHVEPLKNGVWALDARTLIDVVNQELGTHIPKDRCDTIGGFILMLLGKLPEQGERVTYDGVEFTVEEVFGYGIAVLHAAKISTSSSKRRRN